MARRQSLRGQLYRAAVTWGTSRPMYHLTTRSDRIKSLREASRVVRPDGVVAVAAISRFASLCDGPGPGILLRPRLGFAGWPMSAHSTVTASRSELLSAETDGYAVVNTAGVVATFGGGGGPVTVPKATVPKITIPAS
jgi:hypothetical protein